MKLMSAAEMEADQQEFRDQLASREPWMANLRNATVDPHGLGLLIFRGTRYVVPPVPYDLGQQIEALDRHVARCTRELKALGAEGRTSFEDPAVRYLSVERARAYESLAWLYRAAVRPAGLLARLAWRWRANPFLDATEKEVEDLAHVFREARTTSRVLAVESVRAPLFLQLTWPPTNGPLSLGIPPSLRRTALRRAAGGTMPRGRPA